MNGEGCDLSVPSPALAGYLGNAEKRGAVNGACPWCSAKGQINVLRSYKFNFKDSITLCTGPLCLFPLVSGPLDNIRAILSSSQDIQGCKRKFYHKVEPKDPDPSYKFRKKEDPSIVSAGKCWNVDVGDCSVPVNSIEDGLLINDHQKKQIVENADNTTEASHANCKDSGLSDFQIRDSVSSTQDKKCEVSTLDLFVEDLLHMVPTRQHLFWKNKDNLCWLDSLLVALVHIRIIREASCENVFSTEKFQCKDFTVKNLCVTYQKSCTYIKAKEQHCQDNIVRVHSDDLYNVEQELEALRMSAFQFLQPKLQCDLGPEETPVFALPLLLKSDDWANSLFQHAGQWEFWCTSCGYNFSTSMEKTVTTFSQIKSDWHPLKAVQVEKCRNCHNKNQKRKLVLQRISSVLALHFLEGLPRRDLSKYAFDFHGTQYNIRTIIQYNEQREHFVTWIHQPDGLWLEFDDLKHPHCITHRRFALPANQFHLVFWEAGSTKESQHRDSLPDNSLTETMSKNGNDFQNITNSLADDTCIIESLTGNKDSSESASNLDSSIGSTTLLDTFEGLSHSDIVTLTLVEVQADVKEDSCPNNQEMVTGSAESSVTEAFHLLEKSSYQTASNVKNNKDSANNVSHTPELILPSVVKSPELVDPSKVSKCPPTLHSSDPSTSHLLLDQQAFHQSTPLRVPHHATDPRIDQRFDCSEPLLAKPAELFGGYRKKNSPNPGIPGGLLKHSFVKLPTAPQKPFSCPSGITTVNSVSTLMKSASQNIPIKSSPSKMVLSTEALRLKLMKRLKAKKKKLAKLNQLLSIEGSKSTPRPDSTDVCSPYSVTSSTSAYDSPAFDHFFAELLSPDMSTSNQSPDSTGLLEMLTNSQAAGTLESSSQENSVPLSELPVPLLNDLSSTNETFLELNPGSRELENAELNAMDIFF
ncbi:hypothetical protein Q7C36_019948 [Tachysurus vachellii]|uniref:USP domain-containing protein n=1 Tax=Tachysurus vachellii TaxID=175792 RepID=A0AA88LSU5_TACVA|nr:SUMO-specific isopeptidase USPL1 [Tachysurus vachellii]KAK2823348.1 hypothetical protein Q7C36_019948 [Tachysurus vachellii]